VNGLKIEHKKMKNGVLRIIITLAKEDQVKVLEMGHLKIQLDKYEI